MALASKKTTVKQNKTTKALTPAGKKRRKAARQASLDSIFAVTPRKSRKKKNPGPMFRRHNQPSGAILDFSSVTDIGYPNPDHAEVYGDISKNIYHCLRYDCNETRISMASFSARMLITHMSNLEDHFEERTSKEFKHWLEIRETLEEIKLEQFARMGDVRASGEAQFEDIPYLFKADDEVIAQFDGEMIAGRLESCTTERTMFGGIHVFNINVISNLTGSIQNNQFHVAFYEYDGTMKFDEFPVQIITPEQKVELTQRGEVYRKIAETPSYLSYNGQLKRSSWWSPKQYRASGRVMIDAASMRQIDADQWGSEQRHSGIPNAGHSSDNKVFVIRDEDLWRTYPFVYGFSLSVKQWGRMKVSGLSPINWREDAFDKLVMDPERKSVIKALVEHHDDTFSDLVEGKGGGIIFLLEGDPGQGKTLTAETVAEVLKKPLYSISVGELGTNPDSLETRLRSILDVATVWDAVLLLDEADIFLEQRTSDDIVRNAMVGVFLRLLEYHNGVLCLTSNRCENIDRAFLSRISVSLHFDPADAVKRTKIWINLLAAAKIDTLTPNDVDRLAEFDLNGRQIKNIIRLGQTLAKAHKKDVNYEMIDHVRRFSNARGTGEQNVKGAAQNKAAA